MSRAQILDGRALAARIQTKVTAQVAALADRVRPGLAVVLVGDDPPSHIYVRNKQRAVLGVGMASFEHVLDASVAEADLLDLIERLNADPAVHGILVQLPLPQSIDAVKVLNAVDPAKDVDGFHPINVGRLWTGTFALVPCTPLGCMTLLEETHQPLAGRHAVVVGQSNIVGKPFAGLLLAANCTVTMAHAYTRDLPEICRQGDILVTAVGQPRLVQGDWIKPGATIIDVGINRVPNEDGGTRLVGDVDFQAAVEVAGAITPVPGGVGPVTIASLLANTVTAACRLAGVAEPEV